MSSNLSKYFHTVRFLKLKQIWYQLKYRFTGFRYQPTPLNQEFTFDHIQPFYALHPFLRSFQCVEGNTFTFLNRSITFDNQINWDDETHGKLWCYHLNDFEYLMQSNLDKDQGLRLIYQFIENAERYQNSMEPYPVSLRLTYWVHFLLMHQIEDQKIVQSIYAQLIHLKKHLEFHLMGNHLLENCIALFTASYYIGDEELKKRANTLLRNELMDQIISDGAHQEISPSYQAFILTRLLACYQLSKLDKNNTNSITDDLKKICNKMLSWINAITFSNDSLPRVNDFRPTDFTMTELNHYASKLGLESLEMRLRESGYRMVRRPRYDLFVDIGDMGPNHQPGHAHCDLLQFLLHVGQQPVIVDPGTSTYEKNTQRLLERSTRSHNTVMVNGEEQSEIWRGFRLGRRARSTIHDETEQSIIASHKGFRNSSLHQRKFHWSQNQIVIEDQIQEKSEGTFYLHFHPDVHFQISEGNLISNMCTIQFDQVNAMELTKYQYAHDFNHTQSAQKAIVSFKTKLKTRITIHEDSFSD